jgi:hypothetical protein
MRSGRFGFREEPEKKDEPRASVMPEHRPTVDPFFADAVFKEFTPEETEMVQEKVGGGKCSR